MDSPANNYILCGNIIASTRGVTLVDRGRQVQHVPMADIGPIKARYGTAANRPLLETTMGALLTGCAVWGLITLDISLRSLRYDSMLLILGLFGISMLYDVIKKRHFLEITSRGQIVRVPFSRKTDPKDIRQFCDDARQRWAYDISSEV